MSDDAAGRRKATRGKQDAGTVIGEDLEKLPLERCFEELERIVAQLESPATSLEDSLKLFEQGMKLSQRCSRELTAVEKRIKIILESASGEVQLENFEAQEQQE
jgi:exodeoxyribonuclease VII small subunit